MLRACDSRYTGAVHALWALICRAGPGGSAPLIAWAQHPAGRAEASYPVKRHGGPDMAAEPGGGVRHEQRVENGFLAGVHCGHEQPVQGRIRQRSGSSELRVVLGGRKGQRVVAATPGTMPRSRARARLTVLPARL